MQAGSHWKSFRRRLRYWLDHDKRQRWLREEMEFHIDSMAQDLVAQGMSEQEARVTARRKFGNMTQNSEEARSIWIVRWMNDLVHDLRYSFRGMRRDAGFTTFAILIAGLGIGASSTIFSVVNALLLRPLPFRDPGRLVSVSNIDNWTSTQTEHYVDLRENNRSFSDLAGWNAFYQAGNEELTGSGEPERLTGVAVTGNFFSLLGVQPAFGRWFTAKECQGRFSAPAFDFRFRRYLRSRHSDRYFYSLAADGQNKTSGKHDEGRRTAEARRDDRTRAGGVQCVGKATRESNIRNGTQSYRGWRHCDNR